MTDIEYIEANKSHFFQSYKSDCPLYNTSTNPCVTCQFIDRGCCLNPLWLQTRLAPNYTKTLPRYRKLLKYLQTHYPESLI